MSKVVKGSGKNSRQSGSQKMHGSYNEKKLLSLGGSRNNNDKKPGGFLSRHDKPASGRNRGR